MKRDPLIVYILSCVALFASLAAVAFAYRASSQTSELRRDARLERVDDLNRQMAGIRAIIACLGTVPVGDGQAVVVMRPECTR